MTRGVKTRYALLVGVFSLLLTFLPSLAPAAESESYTLQHDRYERHYLLYRPSGLDRADKAPLVIMLHGGYGDGAQAEKAYGWDKEADKQGFVVAYPDGIKRSWNAGGLCCGAGAREQVDDVGFLTQLIATITANENIDPQRIYLTGMSNGAAMAYRYGCEGSMPIAAIGAVSGSLAAACPHTHAISLMEIHGLTDQRVPFDGGIGPKGTVQVPWLPVESTLDSFRTANQCPPSVTQASPSTRMEIANCAIGHQVILIGVEGAGHQWPGSVARSGLMAQVMHMDPPSQALNATATLWNFFQNHRD